MCDLWVLQLVPLFKDFDRRNEGFVTKEQFSRVLRVESLMPSSVPAVNALVKKFAGAAERTSLVDYRSFIELVDPRVGTWPGQRACFSYRWVPKFWNH